MRIISVKDEWPDHHMSTHGVLPPLVEEILTIVEDSEKGVVLDDGDRLALGLKGPQSVEQSLRRYASYRKLRLSIHNDRDDDGRPVQWVRKHPQQKAAKVKK